jgi:DNA-binding NarL/FixJ family response regulator
VRAAFENGASGYVVKQSGPSQLRTAIREVLAGRQYVSPDVEYDGGDARPGGRAAGSALTERQIEVLALIAAGKSAKEIAEIMAISPRTVEFHRANIMDILNLRSTAELTRYALEHGFAS